MRWPGAWLPAVAALVATLLLSGCEAALDIRVELDRDGAGTLAVSVSADEELLSQAADAGADPLTSLATSGAQLSGWEVVDRPLPSTEGGGRRVELRTAIGGPDELATRSAQLAEALAAPEVELFEGFTVELDERTIRLRGRAGMVATPVVGELGLQPQEVVALLEDSAAFRYTLRARLPGPVLDSNADQQPAASEAGELVWQVAPGETVELDALGERPQLVPLPPLPPLPLVGAGAAVVVLLGGVGLALRRRR